MAPTSQLSRPGSRRIFVGWLLVALTLCAVISACGSSGGSEQLEISLILPPDVTTDPFSGVKYIRMTVTGDGIINPLVQTYGYDKHQGRIRGIPFGSNIQVTIEGIIDSPDGLVVARGKSQPFSTSSKVVPDVNILFGRVLSFMPTTSAKNKSISKLFEDRVGAPLTELPDGRILITGGATFSPDGTVVKVTNTAVIFDPNTGDFETLQQTLGFPRAFHSATVLNDGTVLLAGGVTLINNQLDSIKPAERFNPLNLAFSPAGTLEHARAYHTAIKIADGTVVLLGGLQPGANQAFIGSVERYLPESGTFQRLNNLISPRANHTATLDPSDGQTIVLIGGSNDSGGLNTIEIYAGPSLGGSPQPGPTLKSTRVFHSATVLSDLGMIAIVGGFESEKDTDKPVAGCEFFSFLERKLLDAPTALLNSPRGHHTAIALDGRRLLIYGGLVGAGIINGAEILNATSQTDVQLFNLSTKPIAPRAMARAIKLKNDMVLILGGVSSRASMLGERRGELFNPDSSR